MAVERQAAGEPASEPAGAPERAGADRRALLPHRGRAAVMAILNRTPDSFYDRGATWAFAAAEAAIDRAVAEGADFVDVGGVKAGPGPPVDAAEELHRVLPTVEAVRERHPQVRISLDTYRAEVAREVCAVGIDLINDTWGGADPELGAVAAEFGTGIVCSHAGGAVPRTRPHRVRYRDVVAEVVDDLVRQAERHVATGVDPARILVDPTHDFGKNTFHGLALLRRLDELVATGWPVLMALSNKDFVGETLGVTRVEDRLEGTLAATALAAEAGATMFRAHEVAATRRVLDMVASIRGTRPPARTVRGLA